MEACTACTPSLEPLAPLWRRRASHSGASRSSSRVQRSPNRPPSRKTTGIRSRPYRATRRAAKAAMRGSQSSAFSPMLRMWASSSCAGSRRLALDAYRDAIKPVRAVRVIVQEELLTRAGCLPELHGVGRVGVDLVADEVEALQEF